MKNNTDDFKDVFFFIPHTHWEGAAFKTREAYLDMGLPHILRAMRLLKANPNYHFTLDQVCYVKPFLGKGYFREKLGVDVTVGWQLDTFGHHAQVLQLLEKLMDKVSLDL